MKHTRKRFGALLRLFAVAVLFTCEKVPDYCGMGELYDPSCQFCFAGKAYNQCGGNNYNPLTQGCIQGAEVGTRCLDEAVVKLGTPCGGYTLSTAAIPEDGGSVKRTPDGPNYATGDTVVLSAIPNPNGEFTFVGWAGALTSAAPTVTIEMKANKPLVAMFRPTTPGTLTTTALPENGGTIARNPNKTAYNTGESVTVTATAKYGYTFGGWAGADSSKNPTLTLTMDESQTLVAIFTPTVHTLTVNATPAEAGAVFVNGTALSGATSQDFGTRIEIIAAAEKGYAFSGWSGTAAFDDANSPKTMVTLEADATITANFRQGAGGTGTSGGNGGGVGVGGGGSGQFTDDRDGRTYRTVTIVGPMGSQTWMAENLNVVTGNSWCYGEGGEVVDGQDDVGYRTLSPAEIQANCNTYGRLYTWDAAMTACPFGWHLASSLEWDILMVAVGGEYTDGKKLKSTNGWNNNGNGTDDFGFSALPGGYYYGSSFGNAGYNGYWWTATEYSSGFAYLRRMDYGRDYVYGNGNAKSNGFSVRCVKD